MFNEVEIKVVNFSTENVAMVEGGGSSTEEW